MRILLVFAAATCLYAQPLPTGKAVTGNFGDLKPIDLTLPKVHVHMPYTCKGQPDQVYAKSGNTYYACMRGKDVCSEEKGAIPSALIAKFDADMAVHRERIAKFEQEMEQRQQTMGDPMANHREAMDRARARLDAMRASSQGRVAGSQMTTVSSDLDVPAAPVKAIPAPIADELFESVAMGQTRQEVVTKLGEPYMTMSGDFERLTYQLTSGKAGKLEFDQGKLAKRWTITQ